MHSIDQKLHTDGGPTENPIADIGPTHKNIFKPLCSDALPISGQGKFRHNNYALKIDRQYKKINANAYIVELAIKLEKFPKNYRFFFLQSLLIFFFIEHF
jgi:hypothetical protein